MVATFDMTPEKHASTKSWYYRQLFVTPPKVQDVDLGGKTAIVTGSNTGIGYECAAQLLSLGLSKLILAVRDEAKGETARARLLSTFDIKDTAIIEVWKLDLLHYDSVTAFAQRTAGLARLDIAVLNAGVFRVNEIFHAATSYEYDTQVNYLSTSLLAILLLPVLQRTTGRLVVVSSDQCCWTKFTEQSQQPILPQFKNRMKPKWDMQERYGTSKLMCQLFLSRLAKHVPASRVVIDLAAPGFCYGSDFARDIQGSPLGFAFGVWVRLTGRSCSLGARSLVSAAVHFGSDAHGQYVEDCKIRPQAPILYQPEGERLAEQLWKETLEELSFAGVNEIIQGLTT